MSNYDRLGQNLAILSRDSEAINVRLKPGKRTDATYRRFYHTILLKLAAKVTTDDWEHASAFARDELQGRG